MDKVLVGRFGAPHGVKGEVRLRSFTRVPHAIADYAPLYDEGARRQFVLAGLRLLKEDLFVAKVVDVDSRLKAERLTNLDLFVPRSALPDPEPEEFYQADLIGLAAVTETGRLLGHIVAVPDHGGGPILEIARLEGGETLLLPFRKEVVPIVDIAAGRIVVVPPAETDGEERTFRAPTGSGTDPGRNASARRRGARRGQA